MWMIERCTHQALSTTIGNLEVISVYFLCFSPLPSLLSPFSPLPCFFSFSVAVMLIFFLLPFPLLICHPGVPLRIEMGPKDLDSDSVIIVRRDDATKQRTACNSVTDTVTQLLTDMQSSMFSKAKETVRERVEDVKTWADFARCLEAKNLALTPWCGENECEHTVTQKTRAGATTTSSPSSSSPSSTTSSPESEVQQGMTQSVAAKTLCVPFEQPALPHDAQCFHCAKPATKHVLWGRSF